MIVMSRDRYVSPYLLRPLRSYEEGMRETRTQFETLIQSSPTPGAVLTREEGRLHACNEAILAMFGGARDALVGRTARELGLIRDRGQVRASRIRFEAEGRLVAVPQAVYTLQGDPRSVLLYAEPIEWRGERAVLAQVMDVTALRRAEDELRALNVSLERQVLERTAELQAANEELGALAMLASHDLRAPLRWIRSHAAALAEGLAGAAQTDLVGRVGRIERAVDHLERMIQDLLELQRVGRSDFARRTVNLSSIAGEIAGELQRTGPQRQVTLAIEPALHADADPLLVRVVLMNLLENAWKFTARADAARIEFGCERVAPERFVPDTPPVYYVRDNGAGFDMAYADKLFQPLQRLHTQNEFEGTGVGLASVARAVRRHGGRVWGEGAPGVGATFRFTLVPD